MSGACMSGAGMIGACMSGTGMSGAGMIGTGMFSSWGYCGYCCGRTCEN